MQLIRDNKILTQDIGNKVTFGFGKKRAKHEFDMWRTWKSEPTPQNLEPLLDSLQPLVHKKVSEFRGAPVPPGAVRGIANAAVVKALNTYNPNKGAAIHTHVNWHLKKVRAFVVKHQNLGRIPEHRTYKITEFKNAKEELTQKLGYPPDALTMSEQLGWSTAEVGRMEREQSKRDLIASRNLEPDLLPEIESSRDREVLRYIYQDLSAQERSVFEYTLGVNGKPKLTAGQIAKEMSISQPKVSRIRRKIDFKLQARGV
jgi:DNA-directed RNA polymerase specialized sigma subunit